MIQVRKPAWISAGGDDFPRVSIQLSERTALYFLPVQTRVRLAELVQQQPFAGRTGKEENLRAVLRGRAGEDREQRQQALPVQPGKRIDEL